ncbi:hypothetical protein [Halosimplex salinum]|uniref:hypothetical protein n=1 Tax=Halosimplex salinum TaxID=1710538 RepID=UPI000F496311|nr:hypothetical protein [Halosimplex salinum]
MNASLPSVGPDKIGLFAAALVVGLGIGTLLSGDAVAVPVLGKTSELLVGAAGVVLGGGLYTATKRLAPGGCGDDCGC